MAMLDEMGVRSGGGGRAVRGLLGAVRGVVLVGILAVTVGCGAPEPSVSSACGTEVDPELIHPLLPPGDKVETQDRGHAPEYASCAVLVDGKPAFYLKGDVSSRDENALRDADTKRLLRGYDPRTADIGARAPEDSDERRDALEEFGRSYFPAALEATGCAVHE